MTYVAMFMLVYCTAQVCDGEPRVEWPLSREECVHMLTTPNVYGVCVEVSPNPFRPHA